MAYYVRPASVDEVTNHVVGRVIDQLRIEHSLINRWKDDQRPVPVNGDRQLAEVDDQTTWLDDKPVSAARPMMRSHDQTLQEAPNPLRRTK
jgi:hypothetical protein